MVHQQYHQYQYGFPITNDDNALFGRLILEINQAGLSWTTILNKQQHFYDAYNGFSIDAIAAYTPADEARLMANPGIIRNRLKIKAAIHNAQVVQQLRQQHGSFHNWLMHHHPLDRSGWTTLFKKHFTFTGGEIVHEFLMSTGFLPGAHHPQCPVYAQIAALHPPWMQLKK